MKPLFLLRLILDVLAAGLLLAALAYNWLGNAAHEIIGTGMFLLLISHNIFNRRWYGMITKGWREPRGIVTRVINLSLLITMLTLLVTSIIISQTVFGFLSLTGTFTLRQIHASAAYLALLMASLHLGLHWSMIIGVVSSRFGMTAEGRLRTLVLRVVAITVAVYGVQSLLTIDVGSKLFMQMSFDFWDFQTATPAFFLHHIAIIGLFVFITHYGLKLIRGRKRRTRTVGHKAVERGSI
ncbi:hypothetical protein JOH50_001947 [Rhizobium leguminosarum]|uniref:DUF4405 domain-containing protein n=1 Tax=Rhizobium leguminosarum TaxID=384 RepID=UPI001AE97692|nr:DUF4405 domain-containing protein [Rhizobium leguminosarum]MBP2486220.1 hypothetical protein [Rhizobium leguminosarum]